MTERMKLVCLGMQEWVQLRREEHCSTGSGAWTKVLGCPQAQTVQPWMYRRAVLSKPLKQTQSSCGIEPPNSWAALLEPWLASFHYLVLGGGIPNIEPG